jgi:putative PIN family toxin of toxin-antitoxin system
MQKKFVIDTSVYITYAAYNKTYRLIYAINQYDLQVFINEEIIKELENNIERSLMVPDVSTHFIIQSIKAAAIFQNSISSYKDSPDPKDNFLFDLALQTQSEVIITQEKALLGFSKSPVPIHSLKWFKENYPVPL